jgi:hypothetical protein
LGKDINTLIARIDDSSLDSLTIPVTAAIGGMYNSPQVTTDITSGIKDLTSQLVEIEKQKLINKGKDKAKDLIGGILSNNGKETDSTQNTNDVKSDAKKTDTVNVSKDTTAVKEEGDAVKEAAKDILGGLFGKKKKETVNKDSVN